MHAHTPDQLAGSLNQLHLMVNPCYVTCLSYVGHDHWLWRSVCQARHEPTHSKIFWSVLDVEV